MNVFDEIHVIQEPCSWRKFQNMIKGSTDRRIARRMSRRHGLKFRSVNTRPTRYHFGRRSSVAFIIGIDLGKSDDVSAQVKVSLP